MYRHAFQPDLGVDVLVGEGEEVRVIVLRAAEASYVHKARRERGGLVKDPAVVFVHGVAVCREDRSGEGADAGCALLGDLVATE